MSGELTRRRQEYLLETRRRSGFIVFQRLRLHTYGSDSEPLEVETLAFYDTGLQHDHVENGIYSTVEEMMEDLKSSKQKGDLYARTLQADFEKQIRRRLLGELRAA